MASPRLATINRVRRPDQVICALTLLHVTAANYLIESQRLWDTSAAKIPNSERPLFSWPAVFNNHPTATTLALDFDGHAQALMQMHDSKAVYDTGSTRTAHAYISFLEVAPWNRAESIDRHFAGLGQVLVRAAVESARQIDPAGQVGLHAIRSAEEFYVRLGFSRYPKGVCESESREAYFELEVQRAAALYLLQ